MEETQTFQNHTRWFPLVHFVIMPLLLLNLVWQGIRLYHDQEWNHAENVLMAVVFLLIVFASRSQALQAQNRVIRLEESLRYQKLLSPDLAFQAEQLPVGTKIALRFASDEELAELAQRAINGEFKDNKELKLAIKNWRGDYLRV